MTILSSLYSSAAGLDAHSAAMDVVSDNIANVNTIGFKDSRARFEDVLGSSVAQTIPDEQIGMGSRMAGTEKIFTQGSLLGTGVSTDLSISGDGFFVVNGAYQGFSGNYYTRDGQFHLNDQGQLVNADGLNVQGYEADAAGNITGTVGNLTIPPNSTVQPNATTKVTVAANLDASATIPPAFDPTNPGNTSNFSTSTKVYDSLGNAHTVDIYYSKTAAGAWSWNAVADGGDITGGTAGVGQTIASGTLSFDTTGALTAQSTTSSSVNWIGATPGQAIAFNFGDDIASGGTGRAGVTSYAGSSSVSAIDQDGYGSGDLAGVTVTSDGRVEGTFTNGEKRVLGQLAMARFRSNDGLARAGSGLFEQTTDSGQALVGKADAGGIGSVNSGSLEQSNVDLGQEFVNLIAYQRGFQANSKTVTTADEMLQTLIAMKQ